MNRPLKTGWLALMLTTLLHLTSCQKNDNSLTEVSDVQKNDHKKVPRQSSSEGPARRWVPALGDCDNVQENCAPTDAEVIAQQPKDICIPCKVLREIISHGTFRANASFGYDRIGKNFPGIHSAEELNRLDDLTFYATLFPNVDAAHLSMFYSGEYELMLKHSEGKEKFFILFGKKGQSMNDIEAAPVFVVPFIFNFK